MDIVVTYDIANTDSSPGARRLRQVAAACERYGSRAQFSVFECRVSPAALVKLMNEIEDAIDPTTDSVNIYRLPGRLGDSRSSLGITKNHSIERPWIL